MEKVERLDIGMQRPKLEALQDTRFDLRGLIRTRRIRPKKLVRSIYGAIRVLKPVAKRLGPQYIRSPDRIEIDVTYACNLACHNCNRSVRQAPSGDHVSVEQVGRFIKESIDAGIQWRRIRLLGGEPTLHSRLLEIVRMLVEYRRVHSPKMTLAVHTNGHGERVNGVLAQLPDEVKIVNSSKTSSQNRFYPFNLAPRDSKFHNFVDYSMGCRVPEKCGTGLTPYGYYPCAVAGSIDRVLGLDIGRKSLPQVDDPMSEELRELCPWCGNFRRGGHNKWLAVAEQEIASPSWREAYQRYREKRPRLSRY